MLVKDAVSLQMMPRNITFDFSVIDMHCSTFYRFESTLIRLSQFNKLH